MFKISIVIPTYQRPDYLNRLLVSISNQTFKDFEVIIVDDNSNLNLEYKEVIVKFNGYMEISFFSHDKNMGAPYSRNFGIKRAKYDLVALVDDDDEWLPNKLKKQIEFYKSINDKDNFGILSTRTKVIEDNRVVDVLKPDLFSIDKFSILTECSIPSPSVLVSKEALLEAGLFDENFPSCQDWDMWTRIIWKGYKSYSLESVLTIYHKHNNGNIGMSNSARAGYRLYYKKHIFKGLIALNLTFLKKLIAFSILRRKR